MLPTDMAAIKPTCILLLLGVWAVVLLGICYADSDEDYADYKEQKPDGSPTYLKMAHFAVSTQTKGKKVYDTVVKLTNVSTQVRKYDTVYALHFNTAPSNCTIGKDAYSAEKCLPTGPAKNKCRALVTIASPANTTEVHAYECPNK